MHAYQDTSYVRTGTWHLDQVRMFSRLFYLIPGRYKQDIAVGPLERPLPQTKNRPPRAKKTDTLLTVLVGDNHKKIRQQHRPKRPDCGFHWAHEMVRTTAHCLRWKHQPLRLERGMSTGRWPRLPVVAWSPPASSSSSSSSTTLTLYSYPQQDHTPRYIGIPNNRPGAWPGHRVILAPCSIAVIVFLRVAAVCFWHIPAGSS